MTKRILTCLILTALTGVAACRRAEPAAGDSGAVSSSSPAASGSGAHAPAAAAPGSHEDWCGEHEVPESLCTRCNASLVPAFKATGDWCAEHGLPESQCKGCNPDLRIDRPPKPGTAG